MKLWKRRLWGVLFTTGEPGAEPGLISDVFAIFARQPRYVGESAHALLFTNRLDAAAWCKSQHEQYAHRPSAAKNWRFRPVRVVETVTIEKPKSESK